MAIERPSSIRAVTANLGCCGPGGTDHRTAADVWARQVMAQEVDLLFLQEIPSVAWLRVFADAEFTVHTASHLLPTYRCRSAVVVSHRLGARVDQFVMPNGAYHGSYLAGAVIELGWLGEVTCVSVHASPSQPSDASVEQWVGPEPTCRTGGGAMAGRLFDSDYVLATLGELESSTKGRVLAAGDLNEARAWDDDHPGGWGRQYFARAEALGLADVTYSLWRGFEHPTRGDYQLDYVLASADLAASVTSAEVISPLPSDDASGVIPSDHLPIGFTIDLR